MTFDANGDGPIATAARSGTEIVIEDASAILGINRAATTSLLLKSGGDSTEAFKRAGLAKDFNVHNIHFVPCKDGVLEYGVGTVAEQQGKVVSTLTQDKMIANEI